MSQDKQIAAQIAKIRESIASAEALRSALALDLVETPANENLHAQIESLEAEIAASNRSIERLHAAEAEQRRRNSKAARKERVRMLKLQSDRLLKLGTDAEALAEKIERALDELALLFVAWGALVDERSVEARAVLTATKSDRVSDAYPDDLIRIETGEVREALVWLVVASRLAVSPRLDPYVSVTAPSVISERIAFVEAVRRANGRLESIIGQRVERTTRELGGDA